MNLVIDGAALLDGFKGMNEDDHASSTFSDGYNNPLLCVVTP